MLLGYASWVGRKAWEFWLGMKQVLLATCPKELFNERVRLHVPGMMNHEKSIGQGWLGYPEETNTGY